MHELAVPAPIVAQAESATDLPGLRKLCVALKAETVLARQGTAEMRLRRLEIARQLCVFGERPEVRGEIAHIEAQRKLRPGYVGGRPYCGKTLAARELSLTSGVPERTIERWLGEWTRLAKQLGHEPHTEKPIEELAGCSARAGKPLADWFDSLESDGEEAAKSNPFEPIQDPKAMKDLIYRKLEAMFNAAGQAVLQPKARRIWAESVELWWQAHGVEIEITFAPRKEKARR